MSSASPGSGKPRPNLGASTDSAVLYSGGVGLRFVASESERVNLGIDYARASDGGSRSISASAKRSENS